MGSAEIINHDFRKSQAKRPAPLVDQAVESRKLMDLYFDRDYIIVATEAIVLDGDLLEAWKMRAKAIAWRETPSGSLPADDVRLVRLLAPGKADVWASIKDAVLAEWVECSNGRLYHRDVADRINKSWRGYKQRVDARAARETKKKGKGPEAIETSDNSLAVASAAVTSRQVTSRPAVEAAMMDYDQGQDAQLTGPELLEHYADDDRVQF